MTLKNLLFAVPSLFTEKFGRGISVIIPFRSNNISDHRTKNLEWLKSYLAANLPSAEIIIGVDPLSHLPFSKSAAVNAGAAKAKGDIFVILDADCFILASTILKAAEEIRKARKKNKKLWFIPYSKFYRLTEQASQKVLESPVSNPYKFKNPPLRSETLKLEGESAPESAAHCFGAGVQIVPKEGFLATEGWDARFRGWGGEDRSAMEATDTLYGPHKILKTQCFHLWHPMFGPKGADKMIHWKERMWEDQGSPSANNVLSRKYHNAKGNIVAMKALVASRKTSPSNTPIKGTKNSKQASF